MSKEWSNRKITKLANLIIKETEYIYNIVIYRTYRAAVGFDKLPAPHVYSVDADEALLLVGYIDSAFKIEPKTPADKAIINIMEVLGIKPEKQRYNFIEAVEAFGVLLPAIIEYLIKIRLTKSKKYSGLSREQYLAKHTRMNIEPLPPLPQQNSKDPELLQLSEKLISEVNELNRNTDIIMRMINANAHTADLKKYEMERDKLLKNIPKLFEEFEIVKRVRNNIEDKIINESKTDPKWWAVYEVTREFNKKAPYNIANENYKIAKALYDDELTSDKINRLLEDIAYDPYEEDPDPEEMRDYGLSSDLIESYMVQVKLYNDLLRKVGLI